MRHGRIGVVARRQRVFRVPGAGLQGDQDIPSRWSELKSGALEQVFPLYFRILVRENTVSKSPQT
ncbi:hypothetical protein HMPREF0185_01107 [Brevundimonas diminuta 470-4]|nr:hypothetical protein HMPREF0185_01107 [Brevundimonas diminuta 470-4]